MSISIPFPGIQFIPQILRPVETEFSPENIEKSKCLDAAVKKYCREGITTKYIITRLKEVLTRDKYLHSLGVAQEAAELAREHGADPQKAILAGILHDYAKFIKRDKLLNYAQKNNIRITPEEQKHPYKLHAPVGADKARKTFGIHDTEILRAIETHGIGSEDPAQKPLGTLEKILLIADKTEPFSVSSRKGQIIDEIYYQTGDLSAATAATFALKIKGNIKEGEEIDYGIIANYNSLIRNAKSKNVFKKLF